MSIDTVQIDLIPVGEPLPFALVDKNGILIARKGYVIGSRKELQDITNRGGGLYIDTVHSASHYRAYVEQLHRMVLKEKSIGEIAQTHIETLQVSEQELDRLERLGWPDLQVMVNSTLRESNPDIFRGRLEQMCLLLERHLNRNPDGALFALVYLSSTRLEYYSATHGMLVACLCHIAAQKVLNWPDEDCDLLLRIALTMNLGMTALQDRLAIQLEPITPGQKMATSAHAQLGATLLQEVGIQDKDWIEAVRLHHSQPPAPMRALSRAQRMARLIMRADMFSARLTPRASRHPLTPAQAMQMTYRDENQQVDEAGAALIKAIGIYPPGTLVRLATGEIATVIQRGANTTTPKVAVIVNKTGMPTAEPVLRDTGLTDYRVSASVAHREVKVQMNLDRFLPLTTSGRGLGR